MEWGNGDRTLVFLHYFSGAALSWQWVAEQLQDYRCVAINLPGFGGTPALDRPSLEEYADAVLQELTHLGVENYIVVGHSMGGKIALQMALSSDRSPQQVMLIAPSPPTREPMPENEKRRLLDNHPSEDNARTTISNATRQSLSEKQLMQAIAAHTIVKDTAWRWWLLEGMEHSITERMPQLHLPVTLLASQDDPVIPYDTIQSDVIDIIPNAHLVTTRSVGHLIPLEAADWVATQLRQLT